jgi:dTDP-4-amino-4,6-dideoxygalactose transaminase
VEDAAEALGATYRGRPAGTFGDVGVLSFNGNKIITTSGGGMLVARGPALTARARHLATQAREPVLHYEHAEVGYSYRMSNLLGALGRAQLAGLDAKVERRRAIKARYRDALGDVPGVGFMPDAPDGEPSNWLTVATLDADAFGATPAQVCAHLETLDIEARPAWKPMHLQPVFAGCAVRGGAVAERIFATGVCLPSGSAMTDADVDRVATAVRATPR